MNTLTPKEVKVIQLALGTLIEDLEEADKSYTFNSQARNTIGDILPQAKSALLKLQTTSGFAVKMDPYQPGDEDEFLIKTP